MASTKPITAANNSPLQQSSPNPHILRLRPSAWQHFRLLALFARPLLLINLAFSIIGAFFFEASSLQEYFRFVLFLFLGPGFVLAALLNHRFLRSRYPLYLNKSLPIRFCYTTAWLQHWPWAAAALLSFLAAQRIIDAVAG
ncbi:MAG: hypothetical protein KKC64_09390 [Spirochaetes bacterium]|nr:hypothetical protein [Spirochaetota bacterium]